MKTYPDINKEGSLISFEINSSLAGPKTLSRLIENELGGEIISKRKWFSSDEIHLRFLFLGKEFIVWEPFGDNSRYTICPANESNVDSETITKLQKGFEKFQPGILSLVTGILQK